MKTTTFIYVLNDPRTGRIRYVGKADDPYHRWQVHCSDLRDKSHKVHWIRELKTLGLVPELEVLEEIPMEGWQAIEQEYIRVFRMVGMKLTNNTDGGDGLVGYVPSSETRKKISVASKGKKKSDSFRRKISERMSGPDNSLRGRPVSLETRAKMSATRKGKQTGEDNPMFGKTLSSEARAKISFTHLGKKKSPETRAKMVAAWAIRKTKKLTQQT